MIRIPPSGPFDDDASVLIGSLFARLAIDAAILAGAPTATILTASLTAPAGQPAMPYAGQPAILALDCQVNCSVAGAAGVTLFGLEVDGVAVPAAGQFAGLDLAVAEGTKSMSLSWAGAIVIPPLAVPIVINVLWSQAGAGSTGQCRPATVTREGLRLRAFLYT